LLILPKRERTFAFAMFAALLLFCASNQYSRLQFNSGVRYLIPIIPFLILALSDHWVRLPGWMRLAITVPAVIHSWVLTVFREPVPQSWHLFWSEGVQLPWFRVLGMTTRPGSSWVGSWYVPAALLTAALFAAVWIWQYGARLERPHAAAPSPQPAS
jgi:hypothetical protein